MRDVFSPRILAADAERVEVLQPVSGIVVTFRCVLDHIACPENLVEVSRMWYNPRFDFDAVRLSAGSLRTMRDAASKAILEERRETADVGAQV